MTNAIELISHYCLLLHFHIFHFFSIIHTHNSLLQYLIKTACRSFSLILQLYVFFFKNQKQKILNKKKTCEIDVTEVDFFVDLGCVGLAVRVELQLPGCSDPGAP